MFHLFELLLLNVIFVSASSLFLLSLNRFNAFVAFCLGIIIGLIFLVLVKPHFAIKDKRFDLKIIFLLLTLSLLFRYKPYLYVLGGQDEGVYVNMAARYREFGSTFIKDRIRMSLVENANQKLLEYYDNYNQRKEGHLPGVYFKNLAESEYVFQFYPLHPLWMAIFSEFFGAKKGVYSLTFFSLVSIISFYLLGYELSGKNKLAGFVAAMLLAFNPLHAFFSKFPVTEVVALAFTSSSLYYLAKFYYDSRFRRGRGWDLFLSFGLIGCFFFTRISGFMYFPFYYLLLLVALLFVKEKRTKQALIVYVVGVFLIYFLSVLYGLNYSRPYSLDIYRLSFSKFFGTNWLCCLLILLALSFLAPFFLFLFKRNKRMLSLIKKILYFVSRYFYIIFGLILIIALYKAYIFSFTGKYINSPWWDVRWKIAGKGWLSFKCSNLFVAILYLSPIGFLLTIVAFVYFSLWKDIRAVGIKFLLLFVLLFWFSQLIVGLATPYHYYYARYFLSEVVPYSLLLVAIFLTVLMERVKLRGKIISFLSLMLISLYFGYFSFHQLKGTVVEEADLALSRVASYLDEGDLLLIIRKDFWHYGEIMTSLSYFYDLNVFAIENLDDLWQIVELGEHVSDFYNDLFVLAQTPLASDCLIEQDRLFYKEGRFKHDHTIPTDFIYYTKNLFLYKINRSSLKKKLIEKRKFFTPKEVSLQLDGFYPDFLWTDGNALIKDLNIKRDPKDQFLVISTKGYNPYRGNPRKLNLEVLVNGQDLKFVKAEKNSFFFALDGDLSIINTINVKSSTFRPSSLGINNDQRDLGLDIELISFQ